MRGGGAIPPVAFVAIPILFFISLCAAAVRWYSPVPFWDMWDGYLLFYLHYMLDGRLANFFGQANEHRIVLSRILFWLDLRYLEGRSLLLIPANIALMVGIWVTFCAVALRLLRERRDLTFIVACALAAPCLSWIQDSNIIWAYQSQFFFAVLVPLGAFLCLGMSMDSALDHRRSRIWFGGALLLSAASVGTMANGLLAPPLLVVMSLFAPRFSWLRTVFLGLVAAVAIAAWFQNYFYIPRPRTDLATLSLFVPLFVGAPFRHALGATAIGYVAGFVFLAGTALFGIMWLRQRKRRDPVMLALISFLVFIIATGAVIGFGRTGFGTGAASVTRYATPALAGWSALGLLLVYVFKHAPAVRAGAALAALAITLVLTPAQVRAFRDLGPIVVHEQAFAGLALKMGIADPEAIRHVYPIDRPDTVPHVLNVARMSQEKRISMFGDPVLEGAVSRIGAARQGAPSCPGSIENVEAVSGSPYARITGWLEGPSADPLPRFVHFADGERVVGVGVVGHRRPAPHAHARRGSVLGYVLSDAPTSSLSIICESSPSARS